MQLAEHFTTGINGWLVAERRRASSARREKYLDDFGLAMKSLSFPLEDSRNVHGQKALAHISRFRPKNAFWEAFESFPTDDEATAKMIFAAMMRLSGSRRKQAVLRANNQGEYSIMRRMRSIGSSVPRSSAVASFDTQLARAAHDTQAHTINQPSGITIKDLRAMADELVDGSIEAEDRIQKLAGAGLHRGNNREAALMIEEGTERSLLNFASGMAIFSAGIRTGHLESVPLLEPRSISDIPAVIYPFVPGFWDTYQPSPLPADA